MIKNFLDSDEEQITLANETSSSKTNSAYDLGIFDSSSLGAPNNDELPQELIVQVIEPDPPLTEYSSPSPGDSMRMNGLAWSAGVSLFGSIIAMLLVGWLADLLMGTSPWGIVVGIVFGAIIGFIQFFRINSEIFKKDKSTDKNDTNSLLR